MENSIRLRVLVSLCIFMILMILISPYAFFYGKGINLGQQLQAPNVQHIFGTDNFGRDLFQRTISGLRLSLMLALVIQIISLVLGIFVGMITGFYGGIIDEFFVHIMNVFMSFPSIIAALCLIAVIGANMSSLVMAISVLEWVTYARLIRSEVLAIKERDFILGVKAAGANNFYILVKYILPNILIPVIPLATLMIGHSVLTISGLSFLGFGVQPPAAEIGTMLKESISYIDCAPWLMLMPGGVLAFSVLIFNLLGDELCYCLNPQKERSIF